MKNKMLITGLNSYVGNSFSEFCKDDFAIDKISLRDHGWKGLNFSKYNAILHVAAIVHNSQKKADIKEYLRVNRDLTIELATKAKKSGVSHFIFLSTMAVYGEEGSLATDVVINLNTMPKPKSYYGISKYKAELGLYELESENFKIAVIRPPTIYGDNCPGNYMLLKKLAKYAFIFPNIRNQRSVLHVDKLSQQLKEIVENNENGIFMPQDDKYFCTSEFIKNYRQGMLGKKTYLVGLFNPLIKLIAKRIGFINKVFGNLVYERKNLGNVGKSEQ
ncbi:NAD-dependent epimerase/dehydratase family protein [Allofrancisella guangzhouensis]|uniref:NAD-dependent epimerase/dehydratase family protein n=1 Tax=Allofrancisella guangzhouensis TaxID=594679 RepID=UPI0006895E6C|nr:NAD-dependent epimerase/dehydratase family protein [Allofrancisella guangzhouensis]MBK2027289.1 NAD-dependent epimerase/dehydratase family protein [Allofrancisella guangzhouensis]MBK2043926.1 NAD-dependent epimerase/dehydratase family protein [Allofrancisella guangzhouensis]MBK2044961.1 NAD-dependent epimerase/dehydratase family protein [Allofrancisella guangzhouensis]